MDGLPPPTSGSSTEFGFDPYEDPRPRARSRVLIPGIGLLLIGTFCFLGVIYNALSAGGVKENVRRQMKEIDQQPNLTADQKKQLQGWFKRIEDYLPLINGINGVCSTLIAIGGFQMLTLSGRTFSVVAAAMSMIPIFSGCCCCVGLVIGLWAIIVLNLPDVRAGYAFHAAAQRARRGEL
jgi:hypothetical protein